MLPEAVTVACGLTNPLPKGSQPVKKLGAHGYTTTSPIACFFSSFHMHILFIILHGFLAHFWARMSWSGPHIDAIHSPPCQPRRTKPLSPSSTPHFSSNCAIWGHNMTLHFAIEVCWDYPACRVRGSGRGRAPRTRALARARVLAPAGGHPCCPLVRLRRASGCTRARGMVRASFLRNSASGSLCGGPAVAVRVARASAPPLLGAVGCLRAAAPLQVRARCERRCYAGVSYGKKRVPSK
jgi:hypothetical protein